MHGSASLFLVFQKAHFQSTNGTRPLAMYETPLRMTFRGFAKSNQSITRCLTEDGLKTPDRV